MGQYNFSNNFNNITKNQEKEKYIISFNETHSLDSRKSESLGTLLGCLTSPPILAFRPDIELPFLLNTDASADGLGAVLHQRQHGKLRVVAFGSRSLSLSEKNYWEAGICSFEVGSDREIP